MRVTGHATPLGTWPGLVLETLFCISPQVRASQRPRRRRPSPPPRQHLLPQNAEACEKDAYGGAPARPSEAGQSEGGRGVGAWEQGRPRARSGRGGKELPPAPGRREVLRVGNSAQPYLRDSRAPWAVCSGAAGHGKALGPRTCAKFWHTAEKGRSLLLGGVKRRPHSLEEEVKRQRGELEHVGGQAASVRLNSLSACGLPWPPSP